MSCVPPSWDSVSEVVVRPVPWFKSLQAVEINSISCEDSEVPGMDSRQHREPTWMLLSADSWTCAASHFTRLPPRRGIRGLHLAPPWLVVAWPDHKLTRCPNLAHPEHCFACRADSLQSPRLIDSSKEQPVVAPLSPPLGRSPFVVGMKFNFKVSCCSGVVG